MNETEPHAFEMCRAPHNDDWPTPYAQRVAMELERLRGGHCAICHGAPLDSVHSVSSSNAHDALFNREMDEVYAVIRITSRFAL